MNMKNTDKIEGNLANVILDTIELDNYKIYKGTQFDEVPGWDSRQDALVHDECAPTLGGSEPHC